MFSKNKLIKKIYKPFFIYNIYYYIKALSIKKDDRINQIKNTHLGETCCIVGLGPSLTLDDIEFLHNNNIFTFSTNSVYRMFGKTDWRPDCYCITDPAAITKESLIAIDDMFNSNITVMYAKGADVNNEMPQDAISFRQHNLNLGWSQHSNNPAVRKIGSKYRPFSRNAGFIVYEGMTVVISIIQLAYYMGFRRIVLLGVDCGVSNNKDYTSLLDRDAPVTYTDEMSRLMLMDFNNLSKKIEKMDKKFKVINATRGGNLEAFPRIDLQKLYCND